MDAGVRTQARHPGVSRMLYAGLGFEFAWWYWFMAQINRLEPALVSWCPRPLTGLQGLAVLVITVLLARQLRDGAFQRRLDPPMAVALLLASLLVGLPLDATAVDERCAVALVLASAGTAWCYIRWTSVYLQLSARETFISAFSCFAFGTLLKAAVWMLPGTVALAIACFCALAIFGAVGRVAQSVDREPAGARFSDAEPASTETYVAGRPFAAKMLVCLFVFSLVQTVVPAVFAVSTTAGSVVDFLAEQAIVVALSAAIIVWAARADDELDLGVFWKWILGIVGVLFVVVMFAPQLGIYGILFHALFSVLWLFLWVTLVNAARICAQNPYVFMGIGSALSWIPYAVGSIVIQELDVPPYSHGLLLASYVALSLTVIVCIDSHDTDIRAVFSTHRAMSSAPTAGEPTLEERCAALETRFGLTERETEVLGYLCRGRSRTYISEALFISESTVKAHTAHIYRKLGVAGKQELLSLLEAEGRAEGR